MSQQQKIDFTGEMNELYEACSGSVVAIYKFYDMIHVELGDDTSTFATVSFGKMFEDDEVSKEVAKQIRSYVKDQKRELRQNPLGYEAEEGRKKLFWLLTMFYQHGVFSHVIGKLQVYLTFVFQQIEEHS